MKIERNSEGVVNFSDGTQIQMPSSMSLLSIGDTIVDGGKYENDGYIYLNGERVKKWLRRYTEEQILLWPPHVTDIKYLYPIYVKVQKRRNEAWDKVSETVKEIEATGNPIAHTKPTHKFKPLYGETWWVYRISNYGFGFDWIGEPEDKVNLELGDKLYKQERRAMEWAGKYHKVKKVLLDAIIDTLPKEIKKATMCKVQVGEHHFLFQATPNRYGVFLWNHIDTDSVDYFEKTIG